MASYARVLILYTYSDPLEIQVRDECCTTLLYSCRFLSDFLSSSQSNQSRSGLLLHSCLSSSAKNCLVLRVPFLIPKFFRKPSESRALSKTTGTQIRDKRDLRTRVWRSAWLVWLIGLVLIGQSIFCETHSKPFYAAWSVYCSCLSSVVGRPSSFSSGYILSSEWIQ